MVIVVTVVIVVGVSKTYEVVGVAGEAVVDALRQGHEVTLLDPDTDPLVLEVAHV